MPLRNVAAAAALCSSSGCCRCSSLSPGAAAVSPLPSRTSSSSASRRPPASPCRPPPPGSRRYASVGGGGSGRSGSAPDGPRDVPRWPASPHPTPYDIFDIAPGQPYTKTRFYQLVKLYHPDRHHHDSPPSPSSSSSSSPEASASASHLPRAARLHRYRLVVAANDLLSDPSKRHLYDAHGLGWHGDGAAPSPRDDLRAADRAWRARDASAAHNATWEDWERWHHAHGQGPVRPRAPPLMGNGTFAAIVVVMCMVGALAQRTRAEAMGEQYLDWRARSNAAIGEEMQRRTKAKAGATPQERVETFLKDRENLAYRYEPNRYDDRQEDRPA